MLIITLFITFKVKKNIIVQRGYLILGKSSWRTGISFSLIEFSSEVRVWILSGQFWFNLLLVKGLFRLSITSWVSLSSLCFSRKFSISSYLMFSLIHNIFFIIHFISLWLVVLSRLSFLLLVLIIWVFTFLLVYLAKDLSIL